MVIGEQKNVPKPHLLYIFCSPLFFYWILLKTNVVFSIFEKMEIIPVITMEKREISKKQSKFLKKYLDERARQKPLYILDLFGINKDKPNLCTYQKLSKDFELWIDSGPRNLGDVVDIFMAGANAVSYTHLRAHET